MVEKMRCWVQLEQVEVVLKDTEQAQISPRHMEETGPKKVGTLVDLGPKHKQARPQPTEGWGKEKVECDECGQYLSKERLLNHRRIAHRGETPFKCWVGDCGKILRSNRGLYDHKRVHHGFPKLKCKVDGCGSEFLRQHKFDKHRQN